MNSHSANAAAPEILSNARLAAFAAAGLPVAALQLPLSVYLPNYYASHLGVKLAVVGAAFSIVRLIDISVDPIIGVAVNATRTPLGRFRPWLIAGVPLLMIAAFAIFMAQPGIGMSYIVPWFLVLYLGFSILTVTHTSWAAAVVTHYHQRSRVYGWFQAIGITATVTVLALPPVLAKLWHASSATGVEAMGWFVIAVAPLGAALCLAFVREPVPSDDERVTLRDYWAMFARPSLLRLLASDLSLALGPAITAVLYIFFFTQALGYSRIEVDLLLLLYMGAGFVGAPCWWMIARRLGKHRTVITACVLYAFAQALVFVLPHHFLPLMVPAMFFAGFVVSAFAFLIRAMIADVGDEVRLDIGKDRTPLLYGLVASTSKVGSALAVAITYSILAVFHFNAKEGVVNTGVPLRALEACYVFVPVLTMFVGALCMRGYKLDAARHDAIRAELAVRDGAATHEDASESLSGTAPELIAAK